MVRSEHTHLIFGQDPVHTTDPQWSSHDAMKCNLANLDQRDGGSGSDDDEMVKNVFMCVYKKRVFSGQ